MKIVQDGWMIRSCDDLCDTEWNEISLMTCVPMESALIHEVSIVRSVCAKGLGLFHSPFASFLAVELSGIGLHIQSILLLSTSHLSGCNCDTLLLYICIFIICTYIISINDFGFDFCLKRIYLKYCWCHSMSVIPTLHCLSKFRTLSWSRSSRYFYNF